MANIEKQIDQISTAFYGSQVRGAIVEGLDSINEEVNSLNNNIIQVDGKTEKMSELVNSSTEEMKELVNEYQNVNTKAQKTFQQIDGIMSKAMNEPTINAGILKNCDLENGGIHGTINNYGDINGGKISNATLDTVNIVGDVNNFTNIKGGKYENPTICGSKLTGSVTLVGETTLKGGAIANTDFEENINNKGTITGGNYSNPTLNEAQLTGSVTLVGGTGIQGGAICNTTFSETIKNEATINGGTYTDAYLVTPSLNAPTLNNSILPGTTNLNGIMRINEHTGALYYLDNDSNPCIEEAIDGATWFIRNKYTGNNMIQSTPVSSGKDKLDIYSNININANILLNGEIKDGVYVNSTLTGDITNNSTIKGGTISNTNLETITIKNGLLVDGSPVVQNFKTIKGTINFSSTVSGDFSATFWTFNGSLLSAENQGNYNSNQLGILSTTLIIKGGSITLDQNDVIQLQFDEIPNFGAMPMDLVTTGAGKVWDSPIFKTTLFNNTLSFIFPGSTLQEGATYGAYALIIGNQY